MMNLLKYLKNFWLIFLVGIFTVFLFVPSNSKAVTLSQTQLLAGQLFSLTFKGDIVMPSLTGNTLRFYTQDGTLISTQNNIDSFDLAATGEPQIFERIPVLATGNYYMTLQNTSGQTTTQIPFSVTVVSEGVPEIIGYNYYSNYQLYKAMVEDDDIDGLPDDFLEISSLPPISSTDGGTASAIINGKTVPATFPVQFATLYNLAVFNLSGISSKSLDVSLSANNVQFPQVTLNLPDLNVYQDTSNLGGLTLTPGQNVAISWTGDKVLYIALMRNGQFVEMIKDTSGSEHSLNWIVPSDLPQGSGYQLAFSVLDFDNLSANYDFFIHAFLGNGTFSIGSTQNPPQQQSPQSTTPGVARDNEPDTTNWSPDQQHPLGTLFNQDGTIYQIIEDGKVGFPNVGVFRSYGNRFEEVVPASAGDRQLPFVKTATYADGDLLLDRGTVYIMYQGKKYGFGSRQAFEQLGYSFANVYPADLTSVPLAGIPFSPITNGQQAHAFGTVVNDNGTFYVVVKNGRIGIPNMEVFRAHKYRLEQVVSANDSDRSLPVLENLDFPTGALLEVSGTIFYFTTERLLHFDSPQEFTAMGYRFENVIHGDYHLYNRWMLPRGPQRTYEHIVGVE